MFFFCKQKTAYEMGIRDWSSDGCSSDLFDYSNDEQALMREIARLEPGDAAGYQQFLQYSAGVYAEGYKKLGHVAFLDFRSMLKARSDERRVGKECVSKFRFRWLAYH